MVMVKSATDGRWYCESTDWQCLLHHLCESLACFSEADCNSQMFIVIDKFANDVSEILKKNKNEC